MLTSLGWYERRTWRESESFLCVSSCYQAVVSLETALWPWLDFEWLCNSNSRRRLVRAPSARCSTADVSLGCFRLKTFLEKKKKTHSAVWTHEAGVLPEHVRVPKWGNCKSFWLLTPAIRSTALRRGQPWLAYFCHTRPLGEHTHCWHRLWVSGLCLFIAVDIVQLR